MGLHTRPAAAIVKLPKNSKSCVSFTHNNETINAKSLLSIIILAAKQNAQITVTIEGVDAAETMALLVDAFDNQFGEPF